MVETNGDEVAPQGGGYSKIRAAIRAAAGAERQRRRRALTADGLSEDDARSAADDAAADFQEQLEERAAADIASGVLKVFKRVAPGEFRPVEPDSNSPEFMDLRRWLGGERHVPGDWGSAPFNLRWADLYVVDWTPALPTARQRATPRVDLDAPLSPQGRRSYLLIIAGLVKSRVKANASLELDRHWVSDWTKLIKESGLAAPADSTLLKIKKQLLEVLGDAREPISK